jgi:hypothetical protein
MLSLFDWVICTLIVGLEEAIRRGRANSCCERTIQIGQNFQTKFYDWRVLRLKAGQEESMSRFGGLPSVIGPHIARAVGVKE